MSIKVFVYGYDGVGWSIDADRAHTESLLSEAGMEIVGNPFKADVIHFVWWNQAKKFRFFKKIFRAKWVAVVTNTIRDNDQDYIKLSPYVDCWVAANHAQYEWFVNKGDSCAYQPFYVNERVFLPVSLSKKEICDYLGVDYSVVKNKVLIGSFQRDSLGSDLSKPKWQKGPELLINLLNNVNVPRENWCLVLSGPRRHWVVNKCEEYGIPYVFVGKNPEAGIDDVNVNNQSDEVMSLLYNLIDLYVVSSVMEGGPKSVIEASLCRTAVMSTRVGLASDMLSQSSIYEDEAQGVNLLCKFLSDNKERDNNAKYNYKSVFDKCNRNISVNRWKSLYTDLF